MLAGSLNLWRMEQSAKDEAADDAARILGLLAEPERLRVAAALILGHSDIDDIARVSGVPERTVATALARLVAGGLVVHEGKVGYRFASEELKVAARAVAVTRAESDPVDAPPAAAKVLRSFIRRGRLLRIPATHSKRLVVLDHLAQEFEPGRRYLETEVNEVLRRWHDDVASLRRYLVDAGFMQRAGGAYWRAGGRFDVD
jgi:hypothetical protein